MGTDRENMLNKIKAMFAKANDRAVTPEEAEAFRAKADELMTKYSVEEFELIAADRNKQHSPVARDISVKWMYDIDDDEVTTQVYLLVDSVYRHARCVIIKTGFTMKVAGFPGDLDYADLLLTSLWMQLEEAVDPKVKLDMHPLDNALRMRRAGLQWREGMRRLRNAGVLPEKFQTGTDRDYHNYIAWVRSGAEPGESFARVNHQTYRRSFAKGFVETMTTRLYYLRQEASRHTTDAGNPYALVIRSIQDTVVEWIYDQGFWVRPHPQDCSCDECSARRKRIEEMRNKPVRRRRYAAPKSPKISGYAQQQGRQAAEEADIIGHPGKRLGDDTIKQLDW